MSGLNDRYIFGPFELIPDRNVLMVDGVPVPLGSRAIQILCILVKHADQVVNGQDLLDQVWPDTAVVESNLRVHLANIRKHLVAATGETNAILTVPGQGYQFDLRVESHRTTFHQRSRSNLPHLWTELIGREAVRLAAGSPEAYAVTKTLLRVWSAGGLNAAKSVLYDISMPLFDTDDVQTALRNAVAAAEQGRPFPMATFGNKSRSGGSGKERK